MRKIFTFLFAALMSAGMFATTVTWNSNTLSSINIYGGDSFTQDGVTVTVLNGRIHGDWMGSSNDASFKFSTSLGNFTRIEITGNINALGGSGWTQTSPGAVWTGDANETTFGMFFKNVSQIVFTIEEPTVAVTGVTLNQNEAQMTVGGETLTLTATVNPNNATDQSVSWSTSDANVATVENGVVTAVAAGNATITVTTTDGSFTATCAVTVTAPEPQPETDKTVGYVAFPTENRPASIELAGVNRDFTWPMAVINDPWYITDYNFDNYLYTAVSDTIKFRDAANNAIVLCEFIPANGGQEGRWQQYYLKMADYEMALEKGVMVRLIDELDLSNASNYAWVENAPEPLPEGIENIVLTEKAQKVIVDGMVYIVRDGKLFNLTGAQVR